MKIGLSWIAKNPVEAIIFVFSAGFFLYFLYFISPFYEAQYVTPLSLSLAQRSQEYIFGSVFLVSAVPGVVSPFLHNNRYLKFSATMVMIQALFLAVIRIMVIGWVPVTWLPLLLISLASLILSVYLGTRIR